MEIEKIDENNEKSVEKNEKPVKKNEKTLMSGAYYDELVENII